MLMQRKSDNVCVANYSSNILFNSLLKEGQKYHQEGLFKKAVKTFTKALELYPENKVALAERACAHFKLGEYDLALLDADDSLKDNKDYVKGLFIKAEALYAKNDYELALVFYHRCKKLRQEVKEYEFGIIKTQEAIDKMAKVINPNLSLVERYDSINNQRQINSTNPAIKFKSGSLMEKNISKDSPKVMKNLLGELYKDHAYLENLLKDFTIHYKNFDKSINNLPELPNTSIRRDLPRIKSAHPVLDITNQGLNFLNSRKEFWKQQKKLNQNLLERKLKDNSYLLHNQLMHILKKLKEIDKCIDDEKYVTAINKAELLLEFIKPLSQTKIVDKDELITTILNNMGSAYLELGKFDQALKAFKKDFEISTTNEHKEGLSRAYESIGRLFVKMGKFNKAIEIWEKKIPLIDNELEKAWLFHEMGHCFIEIEDYHSAKEYGLKALESAHKINDDGWKLNALVLLALCHVRLKGSLNLNEAIVNFQKAFELSEQQHDSYINKAIKNALEDTQKKFQRLSIEKDESIVEASQIAFVTSQELIDSKNDLSLVRKETSHLPSVFDSQNQTYQKSRETNLITYNVELKSSKYATTGSDELIKISFFGTSGEILNIPFKKILYNLNPVDESSYDRFIFKEKPIGKIERIKISYDQHSLRTAWKLDHVKIKYQNESTKFITNNNSNSNNIRFSLLPLSGNY